MFHEDVSQSCMLCEAANQRITELEGRLREAEGLLSKIAKGKCYCDSPSYISCYPCKAKAFLTSPSTPTPDPDDEFGPVLITEEDRDVLSPTAPSTEPDMVMPEDLKGVWPPGMAPIINALRNPPDMVLVRWDDLMWIVNLTERKSQDAKFSPKFNRLKAALDGEQP